MEKKSRLILVQVDSVSGEVLSFAIGKLMELGANNVQLVPTITKKNRPGNIIIIDTDADKEKMVADFLAKELKVSGYHRIDTSHVFHKITFVDKDIQLCINGARRSLPCKFKVIGELAAPLAIDIEHDFLVEVQKVINKYSDNYISLEDLRIKIESSFSNSRNEITIEI
jgi:hypothetical protein